ncbi:MAG: SDR family oxidoreductase [Gemmatimonadota bacterium]
MQIDGISAIVTGSGSGIGRAISLELARHGARVACCGRRAERLDETVAAIVKAGGTGLAFVADVTVRRQVQSLVQGVLEAWGQIDVLFNNHGSFNSIAGVHESDPDTWWHDVSVNLLGAYLTTREVLPHMMARDRGIIINMNGGRPVGGTGYACGKAGLMELTRILAEELKMEGSSVIALSAGPGLVRTEMTQLQVDTEAGRRWIPSTKESFDAGKLRQPEEIAAATIRAIETATPGHAGQGFGPGFEGF